MDLIYGWHGDRNLSNICGTNPTAEHDLQVKVTVKPVLRDHSRDPFKVLY